MDVLSYGGGRQTAGMLAMIKQEILPKPDLVVFADTGGELPQTYDHIDRFMRPLAEELGIRWETVQYTIRGEPVTLYDYSWKYSWLPQPWQRMCTHKFKIVAIQRLVRQWKKEGVRMWIGISVEEAHRRKTSPTPWIEHVYPLVDNQFSLHDCAGALERLGIPVPPKSACYYCPFQKMTRWRELQRQSPELFAKAIALEEHAREKNSRITLTGRAPLRTYLEGEQLAWEELLDDEAGCQTGMCFV